MANAYCILKLEKVKQLSTNSHGSMKGRYEHNYRVYTPDNVDEEKMKDNVRLIDMKENSYVEAFNNRINKAIEEGKMKSVRKNAVVGIEAMMTYANAALSDDKVTDWAKESIKWLQDKFGKENVIDAVLHYDEVTPHIHAMIIPMNEKGTLSAKSFIDGPKDMIELQSEYAKEVGKQFGLKRGTNYKTKRKAGNSRDRIVEFKANTIGEATIDKDALLPMPNELDEEGHIIQDIYVKRVQEEVQRISDISMDKIVKNNQECNEYESLLRQQEFTLHEKERELEKKKKQFDKEKEEFEEEKRKLGETLKSFFSKLSDRVITGVMDINNFKNQFNLFDQFMRGLKNYPDRDVAHKIRDDVNNIAKYQFEQDKKNSKPIDDIKEQVTKKQKKGDGQR